MNKPAKTVKEVLIAARWILENVGWTQSAFARTEWGQATAFSDPKASCFCSLGAINRVNTTSNLTGEAMGKLEDMVPYRRVPQFNDDPKRTLPEVLAKFDEAIASCP